MNIIEKISANYPSCTGCQKRIAAWILDDPLALTFNSVSRSAKDIGVSTATIVRFANTLGCSGYSELQQLLKEYYQQRANPISRLNENMCGDAGTEDLLDRVYQLQADNLVRTYTKELKDKLAAAAGLLYEAPHIFITGSRGSWAVAYYLAHHLGRISENVTLLRDDSRIADGISRMGTGDVLIVVNMPRYSKLLFKAASCVSKAGGTVIAVTDSVSAPYADISSVLLPACSHSSDCHNSLVSAMLVADMLIASLIAKNIPAASARLKDMESIFKELDIFMKP